MSRCRQIAAGLLPVLLAASCGRPPGEGNSSLREIPVEQLRFLLKGYPGDWRNDTPMARGLPEPETRPPVPEGARIVRLPAPEAPAGAPSVIDAITRRRSLRDFAPAPLSLAEAGLLLWCAQGENGSTPGPGGRPLPLRTAPSGGARYPLELWLVARNVTGLEPGVYRYLPDGHRLMAAGGSADASTALHEACYGDPAAGAAPAVLVWSAVPARTEWKYAYLSHRMIAMEAGHSAENVYLGCEAVGAGACAMLGYDQTRLDRLLQLDGRDEFAIYVMPVGKRPPAGGGAP